MSRGIRLSDRKGSRGIWGVGTGLRRGYWSWLVLGNTALATRSPLARESPREPMLRGGREARRQPFGGDSLEGGVATTPRTSLATPLFGRIFYTVILQCCAPHDSCTQKRHSPLTFHPTQTDWQTGRREDGREGEWVGVGVRRAHVTFGWGVDLKGGRAEE